MDWYGNRREALAAMGGAILLTGCGALGQRSGRILHIGRGETKRLPAMLWRFDSVHIEKGGTLHIIPNSQDWLMLDVTGDFRLDGRVDFGSFSADRRTFEATTPSGLRLRHQFSMTNVGGDGGNGRSHGPLSGGTGAAGTTDFGGGGGSGAWNTVTQKRPGLPASGRSGAERGTPAAGGDGGRRGNTNGGLMFIGVGGKAIGTGVIDVRGVTGEAGKPGTGVGGQIGAQPGGGGGGAPGGEGGVVWVQTTDGRSPGWTFLVDGGSGGPGGPSNAGHGSSGQDGNAGYFLTL
jgi:hypothetical protein